MKVNRFSFLLVLFLVLTTQLNAQVYESERTGSWTQANTWLNGNIPPAQTEGITIKINEGHTVTFQDNGGNYRYGNNVVFDIEGVVNVNGWGGFRVGNNAEFLVKGSLRNGQNMTLGQNASFKIWNSFVVASVFQTGNNAEFIIYSDGVLRNTQSFTTGNNAEFQVLGQIVNNGHKFETGNGSNMKIGLEGLFNNTSSFESGDDFDLVVNGEVRNTGYKFSLGDNASMEIGQEGLFKNTSSFEAGDDFDMFLNGILDSGNSFKVGVNAYVYIDENGLVTSREFMSFEDGLVLFIEGELNLLGNNFVLGADAHIYLLGNIYIANHWLFKPSSDGNSYFYICNGEESPVNLPKNSLVVENDCGVLPVELLFFEATAKDFVVELQWATASETNSDFFLVERSTDGIQWAEVGYINSAGNSNEVIHYTLHDAVPTAGVIYYRLKQVDLDGSYEFFAPIAVEFASSEYFSFGAVRKEGIQVSVSGNFQKGGHLTAFNSGGRLLAEEVFTGETSLITIPFDQGSGIVILHYHHPASGVTDTYKGFVR